MKSHIVFEHRYLLSTSLCGKVMVTDKLHRYRSAKKCKKCKRLLKKEWYHEG